MQDAFICDAVRTPFGRYGGTLSGIRADELGALPIRALLERHPELDFERVDDVIYGCANQAGQMEDSTMGWRFINPRMKEMYGVHTMPETAENVAFDFGITRAEQDAFAMRSQLRTAAAYERGDFSDELIEVLIPQKKDNNVRFARDEHPRLSSIADLAKLRGVVRPEGTVTAGNASGINDGACALLLANEDGVRIHGLRPRARIVATAVSGVAPRVMGIGPVPAIRKALALAGLSLSQMDYIELNEAFAAQALAVLQELGLPGDAAHVNPNGGAIALGHPLGASGARLASTAMYQLQRNAGRYALCSMCVGVGQGIALIIERVS